MKVLVTTDGSERSLSALPHAAAFARAAGAQVILTRVLDPLLDLGKEFALSVDAAVEQLSATWEGELRTALSNAGMEGEVLVVRKAHGEDSSDTITRIADEQQVSLIVMDSRGSGAVRHALLGSVTMGVVGKTLLPVMVIGPGIGAPATAQPYRIVATSDGSPAALAVVRAIVPIIELPGVEVSLLRICWPGTADKSTADCQAQLSQLREQLPATANVREVVREMALVSGAGPALISVAEELGASAIAIATHGHSAAYHLFGGSTALSVVQQSPVPVILSRSVKPA